MPKARHDRVWKKHGIDVEGNIYQNKSIIFVRLPLLLTGAVIEVYVIQLCVLNICRRPRNFKLKT